MFDLWGEVTPVPMPSLDLEASDVSIKDKLTWEKELTGVYLSEHPFSSVVGNLGLDTTLCGQIDAELVGQTVVVAGMVNSVRHLFTRERNPFVSAILEDLDGQVEVMVWPKVYASTSDLWQEGNILLVEGKVRLRDDRVQLNCEQVRRYQPASQMEEGVKVAEVPIRTEATTTTSSLPRRQVVINLSQTSDEERDKAQLHKLIAALREFPGQDEVKLRVTKEERIINLRLSNIYTNYCPELHQRLVELVGEEGIRLESNT
jgi:DNA polymerase-3 subunit alpha